MTAELLTVCQQPQLLCCGLQMHQEVDKPGREPVLTSFDLEGVADYIRSGEQFVSEGCLLCCESCMASDVAAHRCRQGSPHCLHVWGRYQCQCRWVDPAACYIAAHSRKGC